MKKETTNRYALLNNFLISGRHIHPLVIMLIDIMIVFMSFTLAYVLIVAIAYKEASMAKYSLLVGLYCLVSIPVIYFWRLHTGLLRYSNTMDLFRVCGAVSTFSTVLLLFLLLFGHPTLGPDHSIIYSILLINFFICVFFLVIFRLIAQSTYAILARNIANKKTYRVLIYGVDKEALLVKKALEHDRKINYIVAGFIDSGKSMLNNQLEQKKVYHINDLIQVKERMKIDRLLIVNENLDERAKRVVIERSIRGGIQVLTVPPISNWLSPKLNSNQILELKIEDLLQRPAIQSNTKLCQREIKGKRILVTGAAGSIGAEIVRQVLAHKPALLILCDQAESPLHEIQLEVQDNFPDAETEVVLLDVCNYKRVKKLFQTYRPERVYHAAAYKHIPMVENNPFEAVTVNVEGTKILADLSLAFKVEKFVMISIDKAEIPTNVMGASKRLAEMYLQSLPQTEGSSTCFITTRFGNILGSMGSVIPRFRSQIEKGGPVTVTHPEIRRFFMTLSEAVSLVLQAGEMGKGGEIYTFDMGKPVNILEMAKKMIQLAGLEEGKDITIMFTGLRPGEKLKEEVYTTSERTLPTSHDKIKLAKASHFNANQVSKAIEELIEVNKLNDNVPMLIKIKEIVPDFLNDQIGYEALNEQVKIA